jgi:hypothetical protein
MPARRTGSPWIPRDGLTPSSQDNETNNGDERLQAGLIAHRRHHTIACLVCRARRGPIVALGRSDSCQLVDLAFSRSSSLISNSSSTARHLFPSWIASFCSTYRSMSESWIFDILARSSTVRYPSRSIVGLLRKISADRASLRRAPVLKGGSSLPRVLQGAVTQVQCAGDSWRYALFAQRKMNLQGCQFMPAC